MFYLENEVQLQTVDKEGVGRISEDSWGPREKGGDRVWGGVGDGPCKRDSSLRHCDVIQS